MQFHTWLYPVRGRGSSRITGWKPCNSHISCSYSNQKLFITCTATGENIKIRHNFTCKDSNIIYVIQCVKCKIQYIGSTVGNIKSRIDQHRANLTSGTSPLYKHFQTNGHKESDFQFWGLEHVKGDVFILRVRERFWIDKFQVIEKGLNHNRTS